MTITRGPFDISTDLVNLATKKLLTNTRAELQDGSRFSVDTFNSGSGTQLDNGNWANPIAGSTLPAPTITIATTLNENETIQGQIDDYNDMAAYTISANTGVISNFNAISGTFDYTAENITGGVNTTDIISIFFVLDGDTSATGLTNMTIIFVDIVGDAALVNNDFSANVGTNTGWTL